MLHHGGRQWDEHMWEQATEFKASLVFRGSSKKVKEKPCLKTTNKKINNNDNNKNHRESVVQVQAPYNNPIMRAMEVHVRPTLIPSKNRVPMT